LIIDGSGTAGSVGAASDILITFALFYALWRNKRGLENLQTVLDKVAISAIETGVISGILGIAVPIAFVALEGNFTWLAIWLVNGKVFSNSLLASLNLRIVYRENLKAVNRPQSQVPLRSRPRRTFPFLEPDSIAIEMTTNTVREEYEDTQKVMDVRAMHGDSDPHATHYTKAGWHPYAASDKEFTS